MAEQALRYDYTMPFADGTDNITQAIRGLVNSYPELPEDDEIAFSMLDVDSGKALFPTSSVVILSEIADITGHVEQTCMYQFLIVYRVSGLTESRKANIKEWLDALGRWLEKQEVNGNKLEEYPKLKGMEFKTIARTSQAYLHSANNDKVEDWAISINATYTKEFDR